MGGKALKSPAAHSLINSWSALGFPGSRRAAWAAALKEPSIDHSLSLSLQAWSRVEGTT
jgi:hypothetical protein